MRKKDKFSFITHHSSLIILFTHRSSLLLVAVFLLALAARFSYLIEIRDNPFFNHPLFDAYTYFQQAKAIAGGDIAGRSAAFDNGDAYAQGPGYPFLLASVIVLFGLKFVFLRGMGLLMGAINCLLTAALGKRAFDLRTGVVAGILAAYWGPSLFFDAEFLAVTSMMTFLLLALLVASNAGLRLSRWAAAGALTALAALIWPMALVAAPAMTTWIMSAKASLRAKFKAIAILGIAILTPIMPVTIRNIVVGHERVLISWNSGINFYIGNQPDAERLIKIRPSFQWYRLIERPLRYGMRTHSERSAWFLKETRRSIGEHPGRWLLWMLHKTAIFLNGYEVVRDQDLYYFREYSTLLYVLLWNKGVSFPLGIIWPFALIGAGLFLIGHGGAEKWRQPAALLLIFGLLYSASVILFFVTSRYRLPVIGIVLIFAAWSIGQIWDIIRRRHIRSLVPIVALLLALGWFCNMGRFKMNTVLPGENNYNLGKIYYDQGRYIEAKEYFLKSYAEDPSDITLLNELGNIAIAERKKEEALSWYDRAIALDPMMPESRANRAATLAELGRYEDAAAEYKKAIEISPQWDIPRDGLEKLKPFLKNAPH